jgi:hypothetical protein
MTTKFDPDLLQEYADRLYRRARWLAIWYAVIGFILGWMGWGTLATVLSAFSHAKPPQGTIGVFAGLLVALVGTIYASEKALQLRLDAQRTLCQLQIERNTRSAPKVEPSPVKPAPQPPGQ